MPDRLLEAAKVIADQAKRNAGGWSARIPPSIRTSGSYPEITIRASAPPAYPNEIAGVRHPVFGSAKKEEEALARGHGHGRGWTWVLNEYRPFLAPAGDQVGDEAAKKFAVIIEDWAIKRGYK